MTLGSPGHTGAALAVQPRRGVGYAAQTPTLGEQLFDHELNTPDPPEILPRAQCRNSQRSDGGTSNSAMTARQTILASSPSASA